MSRHHASRRRTYGRRQHELHERRGAGSAPDHEADQADAWSELPEASPTLRDLLAPRLRWAEGRG